MPNEAARPTDKRKKLLIFIIIAVAAAALAIIGYLLLPDTVVMQFGSDNPTTVPKLLGVGLSGAFCLVFGLLYYLNDERERKNILLSLLGFVFYALLFIANL